MQIHTSDWHLDAVTSGVSRFADVEAAVQQSVEFTLARSREVSGPLIYVFDGDLCDPDSGPVVFRCVRLMVWAALACGEAGVPFVAVAGNHDVIEDGTGDTVLSPLRALRTTRGGRSVYVVEHPSILRFGAGSDLACLPYTASSHPYDPAAWCRAHAADIVGSTVVSHLSVPNVQPGEETTEMPRGREVLYPWAETRTAKARVQGHYHRPQTVRDPAGLGPDMHITGSLARLTHGEEKNEPRFLVLP